MSGNLEDVRVLRLRDLSIPWILQSLLPFKPVLLPVENDSVPLVWLAEIGTCRFIACLVKGVQICSRHVRGALDVLRQVWTGRGSHPNGCKLVQHAVLGRKVLVVAKDSLTSWTAPFPRPSSAYWHSRGYGHPVPRQFQRHEAAADLKNWWTSDEPGARGPLEHFTSA